VRSRTRLTLLSLAFASTESATKAAVSARAAARKAGLVSTAMFRRPTVSSSQVCGGVPVASRADVRATAPAHRSEGLQRSKVMNGAGTVALKPSLSRQRQPVLINLISQIRRQRMKGILSLVRSV
jgi:hypothetical protein